MNATGARDINTTYDGRMWMRNQERGPDGARHALTKHIAPTDKT